MIKGAGELLFQLQTYKNPQNRIQRLVKAGTLFPIRRGLYETHRNVSMRLLAGTIYGPSYISFTSALSYYGLIPERVYACTSATQNKNRTKSYHTPFGDFYYHDIPREAYPYGVVWKQEGDSYSYLMAAPEKALCDLLYLQPSVYSRKALEEMLFSDLRIDEEGFSRLNHADLAFLCPKYHKTTLNQLEIYLWKENHR